MKNNFDLPDTRKDWLSDLAESVALRYSSNGLVLPEIIARAKNISFSIDNYEDCFDGLLEFDKSQGFHIYINSNQSELRLRFSFAHELGHYFIDEHSNALSSGIAPAHSSFTEFASEVIIEREADYFAACLLMPHCLVKKDYRITRKFSWQIIQDIGQRYQASSLAVLYRILSLDLHPIMIIKAVKGVIVNFRKSHDFYYFLGSFPHIPEDTLMSQYYHKGYKSSQTEQLWAPDWFETTKESKIYERCIYYDLTKTCYSVVWAD